MNKTIGRLLIFFIGVPAFCALIFLLPFYKNLPFNALSTLLTAMGAVELSVMLRNKGFHVSKIEAFILGSLAPLAATLSVCLGFPSWIVSLFIMAGASWALLSRAFTNSKNLGNIINNIAGCFMVMIYPGFFTFWIIKISVWENPGAIFLFLLIVFINDSAAWFFGNLFGKNNRGIIPASPNKSVAGFICGVLSATIISALAAFFFPSFFSATVVRLELAFVLGFCTGIFATLGDLAESVIKRSCDVKDSGRLMLGRGGVLDSEDSLAAAAPVFFALYYLFFI